MNKYSYVTLLSSDDYVEGVLLLKESLRMVDSKYPLLCIATENLSKETLDILNKANISYKVVKQIPVSEAIYENNKKINPTRAEIWKYTFTKFYIWTLTEFDKIIFLDADLLILKNLDHCFEYDELTAAVDGEYFNLWPNNFHFNSGFMVIKPAAETFSKLIDFAMNINPETTLDYLGQKYIIADQDILNMYFKDWQTKKENQLNKYYNVFPPYILKDNEQDLIDNCYFVHFVGFKPWCIKEYYKLANTKNSVSSYFYCLAAAIVGYAEKNNYKDINWLTEKENIFLIAIYIARNKVVDLATANLFIEDDNFKNTLELKEPLLKILKHIYNNKVVSGVQVSNAITSIEVGDADMTMEIYKLFELAIIDKYKKY